MINRRNTVFAGLAAAGAALAAPALARDKSAKATVLIEQTFLKANPDLKTDLRAFIEANWFAMDALGVQQGIFTSYWLMKDIDPNNDWDFVMAVGYPQDGGFEQADTNAKFKAIRAAHKEVRINDRGLKELGSIVRHHRLKIVGGTLALPKKR
jgi:hypothetical protein